MELKQLQSFAAVVKYHSFTKAAEALYLSQPTVSTHIRLLEEELRSSLIVRTTKSIEVTPRGQELYHCACSMLGLRDGLLRRWADDGHRVIQLGASTIPSAYLLPELLPAYGRDHGEVYFTVHQSDSQGVADGLRDRRFDLGMVGMDCSDEMLACLPFYQDRMVLITPVNEHFQALAQQGEGALAALLSEPIILREQGSGSKKSAQRLFECLGLAEEALHVTARINDQESIKNLVAGGLGVSVISERAAHNFVAEKRLLRFELPEDSARRSFYLAFRKHDVLSPYVAEFVRYVRRHFAR